MEDGQSACTGSSCCIIVDLYIWMKPLVPVIRGENVTTCKASPASPIVMLDVGTVRCVSDSIPTALFPHGPDWARLTRRDRLSHVAGDAPLACCLSLHLTAISWMQPDNRLRKRCEWAFPQYDTRCQGSRTLQPLRFLRPVLSTRWCRTTFAPFAVKQEWKQHWLCGFPRFTFLSRCILSSSNHQLILGIVLKGKSIYDVWCHVPRIFIAVFGFSCFHC